MRETADPPPMRAHVAGLVVGALVAPLLLSLGAWLIDGEQWGTPGAAIAETLPITLVVLVTAGVTALPLSLVIERVWPRPRRLAATGITYAALGALYAASVQAWLLGAVTWRLVAVGALGAVLARAAGGGYARLRARGAAVWTEGVRD